MGFLNPNINKIVIKDIALSLCWIRKERGYNNCILK